MRRIAYCWLCEEDLEWMLSSNMMSFRMEVAGRLTRICDVQVRSVCEHAVGSGETLDT